MFDLMLMYFYQDLGICIVLQYRGVHESHPPSCLTALSLLIAHNPLGLGYLHP